MVRISPCDPSNSLFALTPIHGAGSASEGTELYRIFDVYGHPNLFTFAGRKLQRDRKRSVSQICANRQCFTHAFSSYAQNKVAAALSFLEREPDRVSEIFGSLHYLSLDTMSGFAYGPERGGTKALSGLRRSQAMIEEILNPARRRLPWFTAHSHRRRLHHDAHR